MLRISAAPNRLGLALVMVGITGLPDRPAWSQAEVREPTRPILVLNPGGHSAPVQALTFWGDGAQLLSGGMDKVVHVWDINAPRLGANPGPAWTLRPPIWRGSRGVIYALALNPKPEDGDQRLLAVGGYGVQSQNGNIALYRFPGQDRGGTGDLLAQLPCGNRADDEPVGHYDTVKALAFDPKGRFLASASFDGTIRLWDTTRRESLVVLDGHGRKPVRGFAFSPDGSQLASGGDDGAVVVWDVAPPRVLEHDRARRAEPDPTRRATLVAEFSQRSNLRRATPNPQDGLPNDPAGLAINALTWSPDGRWIVIGRENGRLIRYQANTLGGETWLPTRPDQSAVEALAISPDGSRLAVSLIAQRITRPEERPKPACDVEVRNLPDGALVAPAIPRVSNLVQALAFSPNGRRLAYAGGDDQAVFLKDLAPAAGPSLEYAGAGGSFWSIGFTADGRSLAWSRTRVDAPQAPTEYLRFDLRARRFATVPAAEVRRISRRSGARELRPTGISSLEVVEPGQAAKPIVLVPTDGRWWDYGFLPPTPEHPQLALAVATQAGVAIYAVGAEGRAFQRVRMLVGHSGPVYSLAPSPDGRWLATGSADQTIRLWPLAGLDTLANFGAKFSEDSPVTVKEVAPRGFAQAMGLETADVVEKLFIAGKPREPREAVAALDAAPPEVRLEFVVRRGERTIELGTTKRDSPALNFFPSKDREWILWMPQGFYDTSIAGDRRFLGWHRNGARVGGGIDIEAPPDYFAIDRFEAELRRPALLDALLERADLGAALALAPAAPKDVPAVVADDAPPRVEWVEPQLPASRRLVISRPELAIRSREGAAGRHLLGAIRFLVDGQVQKEVTPQAAEADTPVTLTLTPGLHHVNIVAVDDQGRERPRTIPVDYVPAPIPVPPIAPKPVPESPTTHRLVVLALGVETFATAREMPTIPFAANDARDVAAFLTDPRTQRFGAAAESRVVANFHASQAREALERLDAERANHRWGPGDTLIVMVESHVLLADRQSLILGADAGPGSPPVNAIAGSDWADSLGEIAGYGARVVVLIDGVHNQPAPRPPGWDSRVDQWARQLYRHNIIAFVASIQGPSRRLASRSHGAFAEAILGSLDARNRVRLSPHPDAPMNLETFRDTVETSVQRLTGLQQFARCYVPATLSPLTPIFDPPADPLTLTAQP